MAANSTGRFRVALATLPLQCQSRDSICAGGHLCCSGRQVNLFRGATHGASAAAAKIMAGFRIDSSPSRRLQRLLLLRQRRQIRNEGAEFGRSRRRKPRRQSATISSNWLAHCCARKQSAATKYHYSIRRAAQKLQPPEKEAAKLESGRTDKRQSRLLSAAAAVGPSQRLPRRAAPKKFADKLRRRTWAPRPLPKLRYELNCSSLRFVVRTSRCCWLVGVVAVVR